VRRVSHFDLCGNAEDDQAHRLRPGRYSVSRDATVVHFHTPVVEKSLDCQLDLSSPSLLG
jgi:hypothetical protein